MKAKDQMTDGISLQSTGGLKIKRKESKLKLKIRKALTSLKTIITPKTRLETSESMINPDSGYSLPELLNLTLASKRENHLLCFQ